MAANERRGGERSPRLVSMLSEHQSSSESSLNIGGPSPPRPQGEFSGPLSVGVGREAVVIVQKSI